MIDFSDNDIVKIDGFPLLKRLTGLLFNNNKITHIDTGLGGKIANLQTLILTNNKITNLPDLDSLGEFRKLTTLSLLKNPVIRQPHYRLYMLYKIPSLKFLDFQKVKKQEREDAKSMFGGEIGQKLRASIEKTRTFEPGRVSDGLTPEQKEKIRVALAKAGTLAEVQNLDRILQTQKFPKDFDTKYGEKKVQQPEEVREAGEVGEEETQETKEVRDVGDEEKISNSESMLMDTETNQ